MRVNTNMISIIIALTLLIIITTSVFVQYSSAFSSTEQIFSHTVIYEIGGLISIKREIGHAGTSGTVKRQQVAGYGDMSRMESIRIADNIITVDEVSDWSTAANAISGLTITTMIDLCNRPMSAAAETYSYPGFIVYQNDVISPYNPAAVKKYLDIYSLTQQIWSVSVMTNPGEEGSFHSEFFTAYGPGPYEKLYGVTDQFGDTKYFEDKYMWEYDKDVILQKRNSKLEGYKRGNYYVGNYFNIEQYAYTSGGALRRFISLSSPFTNTLLEEDFEVIGMASIRESFNMHNLKAGHKALTLSWYELF